MTINHLSLFFCKNGEIEAAHSILCRDWASRHSLLCRDWASRGSAFPLPLVAGDWARPYGLRIPSLLAGEALAEMNRCACSTPFFVLTVLLQASLQRPAQNKKKPEDFHLPVHFSGEGGIRTPGSSQINGFQDRRNRPLCHLSKSSAFALGLQR